MRRLAPVVALLLLCYSPGCAQQSDSNTPTQDPQLLAAESAGGAIPASATTETAQGVPGCSDVVEIDGPGPVPTVLDRSCRRFAEARDDVELEYVRNALRNTTIRILESPAHPEVCPPRRPACARVEADRATAEVVRDEWRRFLPNLVYRILLARFDPEIDPEDHNDELRELGLCGNSRACGGFHPPCISPGGGIYPCDSPLRDNFGLD